MTGLRAGRFTQLSRLKLFTLVVVNQKLNVEELLIVHAKIENWSSQTVQGIHYYEFYY